MFLNCVAVQSPLMRECFLVRADLDFNIAVRIAEIRLTIPDCKDVDEPQVPSYLLRVRAVNIVNATQLKGPWSDPVEVNCHSDGVYLFLSIKKNLTYPNLKRTVCKISCYSPHQPLINPLNAEQRNEKALCATDIQRDCRAFQLCD